MINNIILQQEFSDMNNHLQSFQQPYNKFLIYENSLPLKLRLKLKFIAKSCLNKNIPQSQFRQLDLDQKQSILKLSNESKMQIFISTINCCAQKDSQSNEIKASIKIDQFLSRWEKCQINIKDKNLQIMQKNRKIFPFKNLQLYKPLKTDSQKVIFGIVFNSTKYLLGFEDKKIAFQTCKKIDYYIKLNLKQSIFDQQKISQQKFKEDQILNKKSIKQLIEDKTTQTPLFNQLQYFKLLQQNNLKQLQVDQQYRVQEYLQKFNNARILKNNHVQNSFKIQIFLQNHDCQKVIQYLSQPNLWNPNILQSEIITKLDRNLFIMYQKHKPYHYNYRQRDFVFLRSAFKINNNYYIIDKSIQHQDYPAYNLIVRGQINQRSILLKIKPNNQFMLLICKLSINYGGYNNNENNQSMSIKQLESFGLFQEYWKEIKSFEKQSKIFDFDNNPANLKVKQFEEVFTVDQNKDFSDSPTVNISEQEQQQLYLEMPTCLEDKLNQKYLKLIKKKLHHKLMLSHRYCQDERSKMTKLHRIQIPDDFIFQNGDWILNPDHQFQISNPKILEAQNGVFKFILKQIGYNLIKGQSIINISLPVDIFQTRSMLERWACSFGYSPIYLTEAGKIANQIQQMKLISLFFISLNTLQLKAQKPFNPIIGQTFQGFIGNIPIYLQQISHHPPISAYFMKSKFFNVYGNLISFAQVGINRGYGGNTGIMHIIFPINNAHYEISFSPTELTGIIYGQRKFMPYDLGFIINKKNKLFFEVSYGKDKKNIYQSSQKIGKSNIYGGFFKVTDEFIKKYEDCKIKRNFDGLTKNDIIEKYAKIQGLWFDKIYINDKLMKSMYDPIPYTLEYQKYPLASNSNYRQDIVYLRMENQKMAQKSKEELEQIQRQDKKNRLNYKKK